MERVCRVMVSWWVVWSWVWTKLGGRIAREDEKASSTPHRRPYAAALRPPRALLDHHATKASRAGCFTFEKGTVLRQGG